MSEQKKMEYVMLSVTSGRPLLYSFSAKRDLTTKATACTKSLQLEFYGATLCPGRSVTAVWGVFVVVRPILSNVHSASHNRLKRPERPAVRCFEDSCSTL